MSLLSAQNLEKTFGTRAILQGASFALHAGERVGLVGRNGEGKSTIAKVIAGLEPADSGELICRRDCNIVLLEQEPKLDPNQTPRELAYAGLGAWHEKKSAYDALSEAMATASPDELTELLAKQGQLAEDIERLGGWELHHTADALLSNLGVPRIDEPFANLSGGERRRAALARVLVEKPDLAILDEPTNHLDLETVAWLEGFLKEQYSGALLLITHDRYLLDRVATHTWELHEGKVYRYEGGYGRYVAAKAERMAVAARTEANRQNFLRRELEWLRRQPKARGTKQKARIDRIEDARGKSAPSKEQTAHLELQAARVGKSILEVYELDVARGDRTLVKGLNLSLVGGQRIGVVGKNGSGKSSLLRALVGELEPTGGEARRGANTVVAYFDQHRVDLDPHKSIFDNVAGGQTQVNLGDRTMDVRSYLERFLFHPHAQRQPVGSLSGGERARVAMAKLLRQEANLLVLDEPTNDLDVATLSALEDMLCDFSGTVLVVSHDRWFLDKVATHTLALDGEGDVELHAGGYYRYLLTVAERRQERVQAAAKVPKKAGKKQKAPSLSSKEKAELETIFAAIEEADEEVARLEAALSDPELYQKGEGEEAARIGQELESARSHAQALMQRWEELEAKKAEVEAFFGRS